MPQTSIITGQYVRIQQTVASVGERIISRLIDYVVIFLYVVALSLLLMKLDLRYTRTEIVFVILIYLPAVLYDVLFESLNNGQSLGKMIMKLRVVKKDGSSPSLGDYLMRRMLMIIDGPTGIGLFAILLSKDSQRLGDMAAGTVVLKINNYHRIQVSLDEFSFLSKNYQPVYPQASALSLNQIDVIRRTLDTDYGERRNQHVLTLYHKVHAMLEIPADGCPPEKFLYTIIRDYQHFAIEDVSSSARLPEQER